MEEKLLTVVKGKVDEMINHKTLMDLILDPPYELYTKIEKIKNLNISYSDELERL